MAEIRFLHAADLHLDTPFKGVTNIPNDRMPLLRNSTFYAFSNFIQYAVKEKPDFIVIVGDLYDGEHRSLRAQLKFQEGMELLHEANIPVFLTYGNHDHLGGRWTRFDLPENVVVFGEEVEEQTIVVRGEKVTITGFSYAKRHVKETMADNYPVADGDGFHIGLLHGSIEGDESHAVYAPFTKEALLTKQYDYWALGHIHKRQILHEMPAIIYPGNLQGRHRNEAGDKGFYDVSLTKEMHKQTFISAASVIFEKVAVSCAGIRHAGEWFQKCEEVLLELQTTHDRPIIVDLKMTDIDEETAELFQQSSQEEWLETLQEWMEKHSPFIWVNQISYDKTSVDSSSIRTYITPVLHTMEKWTNHDWDNVLQDLYQHTRSIPYLESLTIEDYEKITSEVEESLIEQLSALEVNSS